MLLHGEDDARTLRENKFSYTVETPDLVSNDIRDRQADARYASRVRASALPSGRDTYRRLPDYSEDLKKLVDENPGLVRRITLPHKTWEGRTVEGVEITTNVDNVSDGKPVFLQMGVHHAREWPSGEHAIEWAFELVNGYKGGDDRAQRLVRSVRTIVIPIVNPDGFNISREAGEAQGGGGGRGTPNPGETNETANIVAHPFEYRRKNCRLPGGRGRATAPARRRAWPRRAWTRTATTAPSGADRARAATSRTRRTTGPQPVLRARDAEHPRPHLGAPGDDADHQPHLLGPRPEGAWPEVPGPRRRTRAPMKALGDSMAAENGYLSMYGWQLYDTTGTTEDWSYSATGGYGYTFEIGCVDLDRATNECITGHFHPPYAEMVKEWEGTTAIADEGGRDGHGNREAYYKAMENAADCSPAFGAWRLCAVRAAAAPEEDLRDADLKGRGARGRQPRHLHRQPRHDLRGAGGRQARLGHQPVHAPARGAGQGPCADRRGEPAPGVPEQRASRPGLPDLPRRRADPGLLPRPRDRRAGGARRGQRPSDRPGGVGIGRRATTTSRSTATRTATASWTPGSRSKARPARGRPISSRSRSAPTRVGPLHPARGQLRRGGALRRPGHVHEAHVHAGTARELVALLRDLRRGRAGSA